MSSYEPYFIGPYQIGLIEGLKPWLLPQEAFSQMNNAYLYRGILKKRNGYTQFDRMVHAVADEAIGALGSTHYTGTLSNIPIRPGDLSFTDGTLVITDDGDGTLSGDTGAASTIDYVTGAYDITFSGVTTGAVTADYDYYPGYSLVGITTYANLTTEENDLIIIDKKRAAKYDTTNEKLEDITGSDTFTGGDYDYFWPCNARNRLYFTNNTDQIHYWDGSTITAFNMDIDGVGASNDVNTAKMIFFYKERLLVLRPTETSVLYPQRARWTKAEDHDDSSNDGYVDAPTDQWIISAGFIGEDLIVWFHSPSGPNESVWRLRYTNDATLPFRWELIDDQHGAIAPFSAFRYKDVLAAVSATDINETDNLRSYSIGDQIPDAVSQMDTSQISKIFSVRDLSLGQILIFFPEPGETENSACLVLNYKENSWARYDFGFNVFGLFKSADTPTIDDYDVAIDDLEISFDQGNLQAGYPIVLAGDSSGYVWQINYGSDDNGSAINFDVISGELNPYLKQGQKARFGWLELLVDRDPDIDLTVKFYAQLEGKTYLVATETVTFGESGDDADRLWVRADNGAVGSFHKFELINDQTGQTPNIHAMKAWFKPAGRMH